MSTPFIEENDQTRARREHLERIRELVGNAYPNKFRRTSVTTNDEGEDTITSVVRDFKSHEPRTEEGARPAPEQLEEANAELNQLTVRVSGRIATPPRVMGKAAFVHLSDGRERLQIYLRKQDAKAISNDTGAPIDDFDSGWQLLQHLDHGDFVGVEGYLFVTKTGELSVHVNEIQFLSKALVPMPDKLHGISDPEIRQRQRYADLIAGSLKVERESGELSTREVFERRSRLITELRRHLDAHGYVEVETPMLSPIASGAAARPFKTHHNALDIDLFLRIAPELYLKRLLVGGFERVYELNRNFRNEGIGYRWNPEFTMLEFYCAYMDADGMMDFSESLLRTSIQNATGGTTGRFDEHEIEFGRKFERLSMKNAILKYWPAEIEELGGERFSESWLDESQRIRKLIAFFARMNAAKESAVEGQRTTAAVKEDPMTGKVGHSLQPRMVRLIESEVIRHHKDGIWKQLDVADVTEESNEAEHSQGIAELFEEVAERQLIQPTFITDFPKVISPLSKASPENPAVAERFELFAAGMEMANGFSELNDPVEQYQRFEEQTQQRERGDDEAMQMDLDYVRALSYGMPPAAGIGIGVDRLTMLLTNRRSIRDVILFPHMRPRREAEAEAEAPPDAEESDSPDA